MAVTYSEVAQNENDDDRADIQSPLESLSPALSSSPMPFLPSVKSSFTPLSMEDSDLFPLPGIDRGVKDTGCKGGEAGLDYEKGIDSTATTAQNNHNSNYAVAARATGTLEEHSHHEYEPPAPNNARSPSSTDPKLLENTSSGLDSAVTRQRESGSRPKRPKLLSGPRGDRGQARDPSSGIASPVNSPNSPRSDEDAQQLVIVKPKPLIRTASTKSVSLRHPTPEPNTRTTSYASNIAQLEATAERLSLTSSIEDAIRDLHEEQKRNDSRRSSILAASIGSIPEEDEHHPFPRPLPSASSILETNIAARQGGYSPAAFVSNSSRSNSTRLRSGSNPLSRPDLDTENLLSRHGPGKSSVRSVRSIKPTLTHIDEMEPPTTLTAAAMDAADKLPEVPDEDETLRIPPVDDDDITPNGHQYHDSNALDYWDQAVADAQRQSQYNNNNTNPSPIPAGSTGTYGEAEMAFADFDGEHCSPDADFEDVQFGALGPQVSGDGPWSQPFYQDEQYPDHSRPAVPRPLVGTTERPKSYLDPETGNTMLYYPARVPMMLNLPEKLSKKPKSEVRNIRRSQILDAMPAANKQSGAAWLPEYQPEPLDPFGPKSDPSTSRPQTEQGPAPPVLPHHNEEGEAQPPPPTDTEEKRKSRMSMFDTNKRRSQLPNLDSLPAPLRASAFFDLPSQSAPAIELKDGSAMATLDSILDASAKAPVSAFTDHAFAGSLGTEIYGVDKKRKLHLKKASNATTNILEPKKRKSFLHLRKHSGLSRHSGSKGDQQEAHEKSGSFQNAEDDERQRLSGSIDGEPVQEEDEDESGEEIVYNGPPTTLLAELQMRKQQQKMRTKPLTQTYPNGLHSTLLDLDTVAEVERRARKDKKVNLAWEASGANDAEESEDEDTPLGLLMARKGNEPDIVALADLNRPPGLMEQKEMEENEPLSRRRNRLQGRDDGPMQRQSVLSLNRGFATSRTTLQPPSPRLQVHTPEEDENENETLGERMRRLRAREDAENPLPRTRPVSSSFSAELLGQLGDTFKDEEAEAKGKDKGKGKEETAQPPPEDETLGQRRRRLQAEREAREREAGSTTPLAAATIGNLNVPPKLSQRHSMADVLGASAKASGRTMLRSDPRTDRSRAQQEEAARYRADQDAKMAAFRSQIPTNISAPGLNGAPGGYQPQQQPQPRASMYAGAIPGAMNRGLLGGNSYHPMNGAATAQMVNPGYGGAPMGMTAGAAAPYALPAQMQMQMPMQMQMQPPTQMDRVERWRQGIWP